MLHVRGLILPNQKKINWSIPENEIIHLQGPNGSGKSLLLKSLAGLIKCDAERFEFEGHPVRSLSYQSYRASVLYQSPLAHLIGETTEDFMEAPRRLEVYRDLPEVGPEIQRLISDWKLTGHKLSQLSSGQKQALTLLRLLTLKAKVLLLDETMSHLDLEKTLQLESLLLEWHQRTKGTLVVVGHDKSQADRMAGRKILLAELEA